MNLLDKCTDILRAKRETPQWENMYVNGVAVQRLLPTMGGDKAFKAFTDACILNGPEIAAALIAALSVIEAAKSAVSEDEVHTVLSCFNMGQELFERLDAFEALVTKGRGSGSPQ